MNDRYRPLRHAAPPAALVTPETRWRITIFLGWTLFAAATALLIVLFAAAGAGRFGPHPAGTFRPGHVTVTPTTYGSVTR